MQTAQQCTALPPLPRYNEVERLVSEHLRRDWVLRVEHADEVTPTYSTWQQWGSPLFALQDAKPVIERILACRTDHPTHSIRLHAEKVRPGVKFVYWVHRPQDEPPAQTLAQYVPLPARLAVANTLQSLGGRIQAARTTLWRYAALVGMMLASLLMVEQAMS